MSLATDDASVGEAYRGWLDLVDGRSDLIDQAMTYRRIEDLGVGAARVPAPSLASVSTFPPTVCGIATYTAALLDGVARHRRSRDGLAVVSLVDRPSGADPRGSAVPASVLLPTIEHLRGDGGSLDRTTSVLDEHDVVSIQHEYGIYGGTDGSEVIELLDAVSAPTIVTFHTVLRDPTAQQRAIVTHLARGSDRSVVLSRAAARCLTTSYPVPADRITVVPHGFDRHLAGGAPVMDRRPLALTWGLIGPGKGLEVAIEAFARLTDLDPLPRYRITGATHPGVLATSGESYRQHLVALAAARCPEGMVEFDDRYLDPDLLRRQIHAASLIVLPYLSTEQVTSGVLVEAIGAGKPVVATRFPHAVEVLASGAGIVVPQGDPDALAAAIRTVLADPETARTMGRTARRVARHWAWPVVSARFDEVVRAVASGRWRRGRRPSRATSQRHG
jgi:polysaccharide biosynthesis protein PslF